MRRLLLVLASTVLLTGCTAAAAPTPTPTPPGATRLASARATAVVDSKDAATRAIEASRALFDASPGVVLAPEADAAAQRSAAAAARRLHVPMLLTGASPAPVAAEAERLGATWRIGFGAVKPIAGLRTRPAHVPASPQTPRAVVIAADAAQDVAALATAAAAGATVTSLPQGAPDLNGDASAVRALAAARSDRAVLVGSAFAGASDLDWAVAAARTGWSYPGGAQRAWDGRSLRIALYGTPGDPVLGVLGQQGDAATIARVRSLSQQYARLTDRTVSPMLEVIATVAAGGPTGNNDYSGEIDASRLEPYVDRALAAGVPVVLDLQPGRADFLTQAKEYSSLLEKPGVGLALDPEWRLGPKQKPLVQIGRVSAAEVNRTSAWLAGLVREKGLPPKPFVLHEFRLSMLQQRQDIVVDRPELDTLIHVDGQGTQPDKQATWRAVRAGAPDVGWGWKDFLKKDRPVLSPSRTLQQVHPTPDLITYQ